MDLLILQCVPLRKVALHCELGPGLLVVNVVVARLLIDFPFAVGGVGGRGIAGYEERVDGTLMSGEGFCLFDV